VGFFGDYDNVVFQIWSKTNFSDDANNLYHNNGDGTFDDRAGAADRRVSVRFWGLGVVSWTTETMAGKTFLRQRACESASGRTPFESHITESTAIRKPAGIGGLRRSVCGEGRPRQRRSPRIGRRGHLNDGALAVLISNLDGGPHCCATSEAARPLDQPEIDWNAIEPRRLRTRGEILQVV